MSFVVMPMSSFSSTDFASHRTSLRQNSSSNGCSNRIPRFLFGFKFYPRPPFVFSTFWGFVISLRTCSFLRTTFFSVLIFFMCSFITRSALFRSSISNPAFFALIVQSIWLSFVFVKFNKWLDYSTMRTFFHSTNYTTKKGVARG